MHPIRPILACATVLALAACAHTAPTSEAAPPSAAAPAAPATPAPPAAPADAGPPPHDELYALTWLQTATEYDALNRTVYGAARAQLDRALADKTWDALPPSERERTGVKDVRRLKPAIILDIDETVLENSPFNASLIKDPIPYESLTVAEYRAAFQQRWSDWVERHAAPRMAGAKGFLDYAASRGVEIYYVTNRACAEKDPQCEEEATCRNLVEQGIPLADCEKNVILRFEEPEWRQDREKGTRRIAIGRDHRVLMLFGDNLGDFVDGIAGRSPETARADRAALTCAAASWWGTRWMVLPNPIYGSWVDAVDAISAADGDPFKPALVRAALMRERKRAALIAADEDGIVDRLRSDCPTDPR